VILAGDFEDGTPFVTCYCGGVAHPATMEYRGLAEDEP